MIEQGLGDYLTRSGRVNEIVDPSAHLCDMIFQPCGDSTLCGCLVFRVVIVIGVAKIPRLPPKIKSMMESCRV